MKANLIVHALAENTLASWGYLESFQGFVAIKVLHVLWKSSSLTRSKKQNLYGSDTVPEQQQVKLYAYMETTNVKMVF